MPTCAESFAKTLHERGVTRLFGFPGGEVLDLVDACRALGIEFLLTRQEATASFMADVTGQITRKPGVCVSTLGPGAVNMTLGVANAYLDRSPVLAITASTAEANKPFATHQNLDLNAVYAPFTKFSFTLDGNDTAQKVNHALAVALEPPMGPVHIALPSDVARAEDNLTGSFDGGVGKSEPCDVSTSDDVSAIVEVLQNSERPILLLGLGLDPQTDRDEIARFAAHLGAPFFVTPKAKGILSDDHPLYCGVCSGVAGDATIMKLLSESDCLLGVGYDPVESDKIWHHTLRLNAIGRVSIAAGEFRPEREYLGDIRDILRALTQADLGSVEWTSAEIAKFRAELRSVLRPVHQPQHGLSPYHVTRKMRELFPRNTIHVTDVGSVKFVVSQVWETYEPLSFFVSNGLSAMGYSTPGAMAAKLQFPDRTVLSTVGDGGFGMTVAELETCVRANIPIFTVVYNDSSLSLIRVVQSYKEYDRYGVDFGRVDFAAVAEAFGAWSRRVETMQGLETAVKEGLQQTCPVVLDVSIDATEYRAHAAR